MKLSKLLFAFVCSVFAFGANAADITIFYSPTCPHCHHAREFIESTLIYEYSDLNVTTVNVMEKDNYAEFVKTLEKCKYESGGVPVIVVGDKCFQGFGEATKPEMRTAIEVDLTDEQKQVAASNKAEMEKNKDAFVTAHADRKNAISEKKTKTTTTSKTKVNITDILLYGFLIVLFVGMGFVLLKKHK